MKAMIQLRTVAGWLSITTNRLFLLSFLCLALPAIAPAQSDPLSPAYLPAIDTNPANRTSGGDQLYFRDPDNTNVQLSANGYQG